MIVMLLMLQMNSHCLLKNKIMLALSLIGNQSTIAWSLCVHLKVTLPVKVVYLEVHEKYIGSFTT